MRRAPQKSASFTPGTKTSLAVLPLQNLSGDPANDYFSDGMTEEIGTKLSKIEGVRIAPPAAAARFKGMQKDPKDMGQELGVQYLLQGSVRKAGDQVRISVQPVSYTHLDVYKRQLSSMLRKNLPNASVFDFEAESQSVTGPGLKNQVNIDPTRL